ncbi:hypothetical protein [Pseudoxanthomonas sp. PXM02]|uniref:hypothetical protein n=1 Tax=Pseudoxanthomonas sp. PXM02 TaxID=2769294 RepID=UPI0017823A6A|nr:hypothetical protein [Pseudoxanthomonas sp. PXM02]MBD9478388.1 hypothetical protein [Pseudoxanthomonas sp. PXM02]
MQLVTQVAESLGWLAVLAGLLLLSYRAGKIFGSILIVCMLAIALWSMWSEPIVEWLDAFLFGTTQVPHVSAGKLDVASAIYAVGNMHIIGRVCESVLILWLGLSFLLAVIATKRSKMRSNKSFKPNPPRGSA